MVRTQTMLPPQVVMVVTLLVAGEEKIAMVVLVAGVFLVVLQILVVVVDLDLLVVVDVGPLKLVAGATKDKLDGEKEENTTRLS